MFSMIVVNARFLTQKVTGVQRYAIEISNCFSRRISGHEVVFVTPKGKLLNKESLISNQKIIQVGSFQGNLWEQIDLVKYLKNNNNPILVNFSGIGPLFYKNKIIYLHDLIFKHSPNSFSYFFQKTYNLLIPISIKNSLKVITVSNFSKEDIIQSLGLSNVDVVYAAQANYFKNLNIQREKIILAVSSLDPRKNFIRVINAYQQLNTDYKLVFVGSKSKSFADIGLSKDIINNKNIIFTGYLEDEELVKFYNKSSVFIFASLFEGFGIPPLEAQVCGCPCIVSNVTSLPEVYKGSVEYCDPSSTESIKDKLEYLINNKHVRDDLTVKGFENVKRFNWKFSADKLILIIDSFIKK